MKLWHLTLFSNNYSAFNLSHFVFIWLRIRILYICRQLGVTVMVILLWHNIFKHAVLVSSPRLRSCEMTLGERRSGERHVDCAQAQCTLRCDIWRASEALHLINVKFDFARGRTISKTHIVRYSYINSQPTMLMQQILVSKHLTSLQKRDLI
jgi:hypothetical protein